MTGWKPISTLPPSHLDGRPVMLKRVFGGSTISEGLGVFAPAAQDAPMRSALPPDPLGRPEFVETQTQRDTYADRASWMQADRRYRFPEPTHWKPDVA